jgi:1,3,6,8-tetrahydroxynaphthalene synthase
MPILCKPAVATPENVITLEQTISMTQSVHAQHPQLALAMRLIKNVGVQKRHIVRPIDEILDHPGFEVRNAVYESEAKERIPPVVEAALQNARLQASKIDAIIMVSCTGFVMPSLTAWMINSMNFRPNVVQIPIAQLGCAAGGSSINRAFDFCIAHPNSNVLIVTCEFCSLCYQPTDLEVGNLLSNALFGDAIACAVVRGQGGRGISLLGHRSHLMPNTETWIAYDIKATGFHFRLNKGVPGTMQAVTPVVQEFVKSHDFDMANLDYYIIHTGGPRVLDTLRDHAHIAEPRLEHSRSTLREYGNVASASIFDVARRIFEGPPVQPGATFLIAGFGPGITAELALGAWAEA